MPDIPTSSGNEKYSTGYPESSRISDGIHIKNLLAKAPKVELQIITNNNCNIQLIQISLIRVLDKALEIFGAGIRIFFSNLARYPARL